MKKILIVLLICIAFFAGACQKQGGLTPPIATPNQNLPVYEMEISSSGGTNNTSSPSTDGSDIEPLISATPDTIRTYKFGQDYDSHVVVRANVFKPNSTVSILSVTTNADDITSPPWVYEEDTDSDRKNIQLVTSGDGGIDFWVRAGDSPGVFRIYIYGPESSSADKGLKASDSTPGIGMWDPNYVSMTGASMMDDMPTGDLINSSGDIFNGFSEGDKLIYVTIAIVK